MAKISKIYVANLECKYTSLDGLSNHKHINLRRKSLTFF